MFRVRVSTLAAAVLLAAGSAALSGSPEAVSPEPSGSMPPVVANDNRRPAGRLEGDTLKLSLRAGRGSWQPGRPDGPRLSIEAFGEDASPLTVPAPLIRAEAGTLIDVIASQRPGRAAAGARPVRPRRRCLPAAGSARRARPAHVQFRIDQPGTYHYWATTMGAPVPFRELAGALIVDPRGASSDDRVLVITEWVSLTPAQLGEVMRADDPGRVFAGLKPRLTFVINGLSWPATERLTYRVGETARWRVINLSSQAHPMHLHGFYFEVDSSGDGLRDSSHRFRRSAPGRNAPPPAGSDDVDDVDSGAGRQLAVPLPLDAPRLDRAPVASRSPSADHAARRQRRLVRDGRDDSRRQGSRCRARGRPDCGAAHAPQAGAHDGPPQFRR